MFLIVGLGNPGTEYARTRHNLGFMLIDRLAGDAEITVKRAECRAFVGQGLVEGKRTKLAKPQTFMNLSGEAVRCLLAKYELPSDALVVVSDDLALPFGTVRLRPRGTAGGHNGLKSIINEIGTNEFIRLRIGIQPEHPVSDAKQFVLDEFSRSEKEALEEILERAAQAVRSLLREGISKTMSLFN